MNWHDCWCVSYIGEPDWMLNSNDSMPNWAHLIDVYTVINWMTEKETYKIVTNTLNVKIKM